MDGSLLIVVLAVALLIALTVMVIGVGRIVYGMYSMARERKKPAQVVHHPEFGVLTSDGDLWEGIAHSAGRDVRFVVCGTDLAPDETMLRRVSEIVVHFAETEGQALAFLRDREPDAREATLDFYVLDVADDVSFTMEFVAQDDDWVDRVWRVEFESGVPMRTGFDD